MSIFCHPSQLPGSSTTHGTKFQRPVAACSPRLRRQRRVFLGKSTVDDIAPSVRKLSWHPRKSVKPRHHGNQPSNPVCSDGGVVLSPLATAWCVGCAGGVSFGRRRVLLEPAPCVCWLVVCVLGLMVCCRAAHDAESSSKHAAGSTARRRLSNTPPAERPGRCQPKILALG